MTYEEICCFVGDMMLQNKKQQAEMTQHMADLGNQLTELRQELSNGPIVPTEDSK